MEKQLAFHILNIKETKEEDSIRDAYRGLLRQTNPEDDPEGFKRLREAYETAMMYARQKDEEEEEEQTEIQKWISQVNRVYQDVYKRRDLSAWEKVLDEPLCEDLDTSLQARDALLIYLMDHIYLPSVVWKLLDQKFQLLEEWENLRERFPEDFLDYVRYYIEHEEFVHFEGFELLDEEEDEETDWDMDWEDGGSRENQNGEGQNGEGQEKTVADVDAYMRKYLQIHRTVGENQGQKDPQMWDQYERELDELRAFGLYHPYEDVERLRILCIRIEQEEKTAEEIREGDFERDSEKDSEKDTEKAKLDFWKQRTEDLVEYLLEECQEDSYSLFQCGVEKWVLGQYEKAEELWKKVLEQDEKHYLAQFYLVRLWMKQGKCAEAKESLLDLLDQDQNDESAMELLKEINELLIKQYTEQIQEHQMEKNPEDKAKEFKEIMELAWCYFQNERCDEADELLEKWEEQGRDEYDYINLKGRLLYRKEEYDKAKPYLERWLNMIRETPKDDNKDNQKRREREFRACHILSGCCYNMGENEEALSYVEQAICAAKKERDRIAAMQYKAYLFFQQKKYENCIDACDHVIEENPEYFPAFVQRQEAAFELKRGQQVVDDFYNAIRIYPNYYKPYLLAAQVFIYFEQYKDAEGVLDRARDNEIEFTDAMKLARMKILRKLSEMQADYAKTEEEKEQIKKMRDSVLEIADELLKEETEDWKRDIEDPSEIEFELAMLSWYREEKNETKKAFQHLEKAISQNPQNMRYRFVRGHMYLRMDAYKDALDEYAAAQEEYEEWPALHYNRGLCQEKLGWKELAKESFEKCLEYTDTYQDACEKLSDYYRERYQTQGKKEDLEKALYYSTRQLHGEENCYYLVERGLVYMNGYRMQEAIQDFERALEYVPDDWAAYNNIGCCYKYMGDFKKAIEYFKKAAECMKEHKSVLPYSNMADCYEAQGQYAKAIACYEEDRKLFPDRRFLHEEIGDMYYNMGEYAKAIESYQKAPDLEAYYENMALSYFAQGKEKQAVKSYIEGINHANGDTKADRLYDLGFYYWEICENDKKARLYYLKALEAAKTEKTRYDIERNLASMYFRTGNRDKAREHAKKALEHFKNSGRGTEQDYLEYPEYHPMRLADFGWIYICLGETEKGLEMFHAMKTCFRCRSCRQPACYESDLYLAQYYETVGELEQALRYIEEAYRKNDHLMAIQVSLERIRKKWKKYRR